MIGYQPLLGLWHANVFFSLRCKLAEVSDEFVAVFLKCRMGRFPNLETDPSWLWLTYKVGPPRELSWFITPITMVYGTQITIVTGAYKPTYNWKIHYKWLEKEVYNGLYSWKLNNLMDLETNKANWKIHYKWRFSSLGKSSISIRAIDKPWLCNSHNQRVTKKLNIETGCGYDLVKITCIAGMPNFLQISIVSFEFQRGGTTGYICHQLFECALRTFLAILSQVVPHLLFISPSSVWMLVRHDSVGVFPKLGTVELK